MIVEHTIGLVLRDCEQELLLSAGKVVEKLALAGPGAVTDVVERGARDTANPDLGGRAFDDAMPRTALVTGSTGGIGRGVAQALAAEGARVVVTGRDAERGSDVVQRIETAGGRADFVRADVGRGLVALKDLVNHATSRAGGHLDILVNNAAMVVDPGRTADVGERLLDQALAVNVKSVFLLTGLVAPAMAARGDGAIVNMGSISGLIGTDGSALYNMTKAAIHSLTRSWAAEYEP